MRVLVVDDDEARRSSVLAAVRAAGHEPLAAADSGTGWAAAMGLGVDVVVTPLRGSGVDGVKLCKRIRALDEDSYTYVVALCGRDDPREVLDAVRAGADDALPADADPLELEARLVVAARVTDLHRQLEQRRLELNRLNAELLEAVRTDPLTGLFNRRRLEEDQPVLDEGLRRYDRAYSIAMADVDHFKAYNDRYGHQAGDDVLRRVAQAIRAALRQGDLVYRYGGEELLAVFPVRGLGRAQVAADRLRRAVEALAIPHEASPHGVVTVSVGVAEANAVTGVEGAIALADSALYEAKDQGRNRVVVAPPAVPARIDLP